MGDGRNLASIVNCTLCDSYSLLTVTTVSLQQYRGKKGTETLNRLYETTQNKLGKKENLVNFLACPLCQEICSGAYFQSFTRGRNDARSDCYVFILLRLRQTSRLAAW